MSSSMQNHNRRKLKKWLAFSALGCAFVMIALGLWFYSLDQRIQKRLQERTYAPPIEFYAAPQRWYIGEKLNAAALIKQFRSLRYRQREASQRLLPKDYAALTLAECQPLVPEQELPENAVECVLFQIERHPSPQLAVFSEELLVGAFSGSVLAAESSIFLDPLLFAQYYGDQPVLRRIVQLHEVPSQCLNAVLAIEDPTFLEHQGISLKGIARAFYTNFVQGRKAQGGSTITQQLIKNYLLSHEKTLSRKLTEIGMAVIFEHRVPKDRILETYLNIIYMGQNGPFSVSGFGAAARHYYNKELEELNLSDCSLLAAVLNSPGLYNPFRHPERARQRQERVLEKMVEYKFIGEEEKQAVLEQPLRLKSPSALSEPAPYFVDAVRRRLEELSLNTEEGLRVYTTMNPKAQQDATDAVEKGLAALESWFLHLKMNAEKGRALQALLVAANPRTGEIEALVGGRDFKKYPYNRATRAHRQVGSIVKPFVYLSALEGLDENGQPYTPVSSIEDKKFEVQYDRQKWSPENYEKTFYGRIPLYFGLKNSLNAATAALGLQVGLPSVIDVLKRFGVQSQIGALPAMTLGAYELYPLEVLRAYLGLARFGSLIPLSVIRSAESLDGKILYEFKPEPEQVTARETAAVLVGMMKQTVLNGTGQVVAKVGFNHPAAGKTGTTSDARDAWFSGFTPYHAATVWVGYDDNSVHGLTGASGAAPVWANYMKSYADKYPSEDFHWPEGTEAAEISTEKQRELGVPDPQPPIQLIFQKGHEP